MFLHYTIIRMYGINFKTLTIRWLKDISVSSEESMFSSALCEVLDYSTLNLS